MSLCHKSIGLELAEIKMDEAREGFFSGYASKFNGVDAYKDTILPGAYTKTLGGRERPVEMRWNHTGPIIGKWLTVREDAYGLYVEGQLTPGHSVAEDVKASLAFGSVSGMSIGYYIKDADKKDDGGRILKTIELVEISVVERPADLGAYVADVKAVIDDAESLKELENLLRDAGGFSKSEATAIIAKARSIGRSESDQAVSNAETQILAALAIANAK